MDSNPGRGKILQSSGTSSLILGLTQPLSNGNWGLFPPEMKWHETQRSQLTCFYCRVQESRDSYTSRNYWLSGLSPTSKIPNTRKLDLFPSSGEGRETPTPLDLLERVNLNHWTTHLQVEVEVTLQLTVSQSVSMSRYRAHSGTCDFRLSVGRLFSENCCLVSVGSPLWREHITKV
jgi:hypothetical protein